MAETFGTRRGGAGFIRPWRILAGLIAVAVALLATASRAEDKTPLEPECAVPERMLGFAAGMDELVEALRTGRPVEIVAIGSSSTEGAGVGSPELTYPAQLQAQLARRFPGQEIHVVNRGVGGQLAREMLARLKRDVIEHDPELVVWQTGTNDALSRIDPADFRETIQSGIERLQEAGVDILLMDLQFYPSVRHPEIYEIYVAEMARIAAEEDVALFPRFALMRYWSDREPEADGALWASDRFHLGALGYKCVAAVLAEAIEREVQGWRPEALPPPQPAVAAIGR